MVSLVGISLYLIFKLFGFILILDDYGPYISITYLLFEVLVGIFLSLVYSCNNYFKSYINRKKLMYYSKNKECKLIKMENRKKLTYCDVEKLLKNTKSIEKSNFPNSNIKYPFITGYRLELKKERFPFNIVILDNNLVERS